MVGLGTFCFAVTTSHLMASLAYSARVLNDFVLHYEPLSYEPIRAVGRRWKRSAAQHQTMRNVHLQFRAHNREFRLRLQQDRSAFAEDFTLQMQRSSVPPSLDHLYSGYVQGAPGSRVVGSIIGGVFSGSISIPEDGEEFYVEHAGQFFPHSVPFHSLIYSARDVRFADGRCGLYGATKGALDQLRRRYRRHHSSTHKRPRPKRSLRDVDLKITMATERIERAATTHNSDMQVENLSVSARLQRRASAAAQLRRKTYVQRVCNLEIFTDHTLFEAVASWQRGDGDSMLRVRQELTSMVSKHVTAASEMFGNTNFNGITDIKFEVQRLVINDSSACNGASASTNPFCQDKLDAPYMLLELSKQNHNGFCASYLWTYRELPGGTLGLAHMAEPSGFTGGICDQFHAGAGASAGSGYLGKLSLNTGVVTFLNKNNRVPQRASEITFPHELGHNFGAPHDDLPECIPDGSAGDYIMFASATRGDKPNNRRFSICSVRSISAVLTQMFSNKGSRFNCLQEPRGPFCGNSIREKNEECDCGLEPTDCGVDACCYAREHGEINRKPCTLKSGAVCSPSNDACCTAQCRLHNTSTTCRPEDDCVFESFCDGISGECPPSDWKPDGTLCNQATQLCEGGKCSRSVCSLYNLQECYLTAAHLSMEDRCLIACRENVPGSECLQACDFEPMKDFCGRRMQPGAPCYDLQGYCDIFQRCRLMDVEGILFRLQRLVFGGMGAASAFVRYWHLTLVVVIVSGAAALLFVRTCAVHTPSTNPHMRPAMSLAHSARHPVTFLKEMTRL